MKVMEERCKMFETLESFQTRHGPKELMTALAGYLVLNDNKLIPKDKCRADLYDAVDALFALCP